MNKESALEFILFLFVVFLFGIIILKYFDKPREYVIEDVLNIKDLEQEKEEAMRNYYKIHNVTENYLKYRNISLEEFKFENNNTNNNYSDNNKNHNVVGANSLPILVYHGIVIEQSENINDINVKQFENQMFALKKAGYSTIRIDELYSFLRGEIELPEKSFMITFDDGRRDAYYYGNDILEFLNYSAVMFVVVKSSLENENNKYYLSYNELQRMQKSGIWEIESHSYSGHGLVCIDSENNSGSFFGNKMYLNEFNMTESDSEYNHRVSSDLLESKYILENKFDKKITSFAVPFSDFGQHDSNYNDAYLINEELYSRIFNMVFYQYKPLKDRDFKANYNENIGKDFYFVMRMTVNPNTSGEELVSKLDATEEITLPYIENFNNLNRWISSWGNFTFLDDEIYNKKLFFSNQQNNSQTTLVYLDGSYLLKDYNYSVTLEDIENQHIAIFARYKNINNYVSCAYDTNDRLFFSNVVDGKLRDVSDIKIQKDIDDSYNSNLSIIVQGNTVSCLLDNKILYTTTLDEISNFGGVGIKTWGWNNNNDTGFSIVKNIKIE